MIEKNFSIDEILSAVNEFQKDKKERKNHTQAIDELEGDPDFQKKYARRKK